MKLSEIHLPARQIKLIAVVAACQVLLLIVRLGYMPLMDKRVQKNKGMEEWNRLSGGSSNMLFTAYFRNNTRPLVDRTLILSVIGGFALFFLLLFLHGPVVGVDPLGAIL